MNDPKKFWSQTLIEFRLGVDPYKLRTEYPPGDVRRYGAIPQKLSERVLEGREP